MDVVVDQFEKNCLAWEAQGCILLYISKEKEIEKKFQLDF